MKKAFTLIFFLIISCFLNSNAIALSIGVCLSPDSTQKSQNPQKGVEVKNAHTAYSDAVLIGELMDSLKRPHLPEAAKNIFINKIGALVVPYLRDTKVSTRDAIRSRFSKEFYDIMQKYLHLSDIYGICKYLIDEKLVSGDDKTICTAFIKFSDDTSALRKRIAATKLSKIPVAMNRQAFVAKLAYKPYIDSLSRGLIKDSTLVLTKGVLKKAVDTSIAQYNQELTEYTTYLSQVDTLEKLTKKGTELHDKVNVLWQKMPSTVLQNYQGVAPDILNLKGYESIAQKNVQTPVMTFASTQNGSPNTQLSLSSFSTTQLIDGVAIYMVSRFKQDVVLNFLTTLKNYAKRQPLLLDMFPKTFGILNEYPSFEVPRFGQIWSHAIAEDLVNMPENVITGSYIKTIKLGQNAEILNVFIDVITIAKQVRLRVSFPELISYLNGNHNLRSTYLQQLFSVIEMVSRQFQCTDGSVNYWLDWGTTLSNMRQDQFGIMMGLLENQYPDVFALFDKKLVIITGTTTDDLAAAAANLQKFRNYLSNLLIILDNYQKSQSDFIIKLKADPKAVYSGISFWEMSQGLITAASDVTVLFPPSQTTVAIKKYVDISGKCMNIYKEIEDKNYAAMVHESLEIITDIIPKNEVFANIMIKNWKLNKEKYLETYHAMQPYLAEVSIILNTHPKNKIQDIEDIVKIMDTLYQIDAIKKNLSKLMIYRTLSDLKTNIGFLYDLKRGDPNILVVAKESNIYFISKFAEFFTDLLGAKNNTDVANVISSYAAPPNSYKIKRDSRVSISLNSYIGAYGGAESNSLSFFSKTSNVKPVYGLSAPIGFAFSWGISRKASNLSPETFLGRNYKAKELTGSCFTVNLNVLDIGAVVAYRIENGDQGGLPQKLNFSQLLSPGVSLAYGLRNIPVSIIAGLQYTPRLRAIVSETGVNSTPVITNPTGQQTFRLYAGIFYDLPFVNISKR